MAKTSASRKVRKGQKFDYTRKSLSPSEEAATLKGPPQRGNTVRTHSQMPRKVDKPTDCGPARFSHVEVPPLSLSFWSPLSSPESAPESHQGTSSETAPVRKPRSRHSSVHGLRQRTDKQASNPQERISKQSLPLQPYLTKTQPRQGRPSKQKAYIPRGNQPAKAPVRRGRPRKQILSKTDG
jgi:hypothetical protein